MMMQAAPDATDLEAVRRWFAKLADCVRAVDYEAASPLFAEDLVAFGTYDNFVTGRGQVNRGAVERRSGRQFGDFRWRLDEVTAIVSPDRLGAAGLAIFESEGFRRDGSRFRPAGPRHGIASADRDWRRLGGEAHPHVIVPRYARSVIRGAGQLAVFLDLDSSLDASRGQVTSFLTQENTADRKGVKVDNYSH